MEPNKPSSGSDSLTIPMAIIIAGAIVAVAIVYSTGKNSLKTGDQEKETDLAAAAVENVEPVTASDHILGDPNAPVKIVEFSDPECPFCKRFHETMHQVVQDYNGQVAWVYRHFPLDSLHSKARKEAEATECAAELGGNEKFWSYIDRLFEITPSNNNLDLALLPQIAEDIGLDRIKFEACLENGKYAKHVQDDFEDAINSGGQGTPYSIIIASNGQKFELSGAQPYSAVKTIIDLALEEK